MRWSSRGSAEPSASSPRDRDVLDPVRLALEAALSDAQARERLVRALATNPKPGSAVVLLDRYGEIVDASPDESAGSASTSGRPSTWAGCLGPSLSGSRCRLARRSSACSTAAPTIHLLPGDPHALLLEEEVTSFRPGALERLGLTPRETEVLCAATHMEEEADIAWELCLSLHAVRERLAHLEAKLGVRTAAEAVARGLREST